MARAGRLKARLLIAVVATSAGLALAAWGVGALEQPELDSTDARFSIRGAQRPPSDVVVVGIDGVTFSALRQRWPFPRRYHARLIDRLREAGAKVIAYDVQFTEQSDPADDNALIDAVTRARDVVLATTEVDDRGRTNVLGGDEVLRQIGARAANALLPTDGDGVIRRLPHDVERLTSFGVAVAERARGRPVGRGGFDKRPAYIDYVGPPGTIPTYSFSAVYDRRVPASALRGKVVVVGLTAPSLHDVHETSTGPLMSGPEVQANAVHTVLRGLPLKGVGGGVNAALIVLMAAFPPLVHRRLFALRGTLAALALGGLYAVAAQLLFSAGWIVSFVYPLLALVVASIGALGVDYLTATLERERVRDRFSRFVPESVVDDVLACTDDQLRLGGVQRVCTVMFSDLRGFTSFSESLPAERVIEVVNVYLGEMSDAILQAGGTLIAYMGDGIMALFGAPIEQPDHADRALRAAREMTGPRLDRFNAWLREQGLAEGFRMGVGLNTGTVMAGNVGSERRLEYTAIGDTTNTASRLEGLTKGTEHMLFLAESTRDALLEPQADLAFVEELDVRGRQARLRVWAPNGAALSD